MIYVAAWNLERIDHIDIYRRYSVEICRVNPQRSSLGIFSVASARNSGRIRLKFRDEFPQQADGPMPRDLCQDLESFDTARFSGFRLISD